MTDRDWVVSTYDELVSAHADAGVPLDEVRNEFMEAYAEAVATGRVGARAFDDLQVGGIIFDQVVKPMRTQRRQSQRSNAGYLGSILIGAETADGIDPVLDLAFPTGTGADKTLRFWTRDDWRDSTLTRYRNAADAATAAADYDRAVQVILDAFDHMPDAAHTRDLFAAAVAS